MRAVAAVALVTLACATTETRVAVVDMDRAVRECRDGRAAREDLMKSFRSSQATLDKRQEELYRRLQVFKRYRARGLDPPEDEGAIKREMEGLEELYRELQRKLTAEELGRAARIRARLDETLKQLKAERRIDNVSVVSPVPAGNARTLDLTADLIRAADAQPPLPSAP
jgi:Skp family chaperone for outer membrane proteins